MRRTHMATPNYDCRFIPPRVEILSVAIAALRKLQSPRQRIGLSKLDCAPMAEAVSASQQSPENVSLRWRPWLAVRAVAGDRTCDFD